MRCLLILVIAVCSSANLVAQNYPSDAYRLTKKTTKGVRSKRLTSAQHEMKVMRQQKKGYDHLERQFVYDGVPYHLELHSKKPSLVFRGDSVIAEITDVLRINNVRYEFAQQANNAFAFLLNGREVLRGYFTKEKQGTMIIVDILEPQAERQEFLSAIAPLMGLRVMENKRAGTAGGWFFFLGGVTLGVAAK